MIKICYDFLHKYVVDYAISICKIVDILQKIDDETMIIKEMKNAFADIITLLEDSYNLKGTQVVMKLKECLQIVLEYDRYKNIKRLNEIQNLLGDIESWLDESVTVSDVRLAIVAIIRDNAKDVREWIEYHRLVGVEHFYIYDNESTDGLRDILAKYIDDYIVTYRWYPGNEVQLQAYNDAIKNYRHDAKYMAFIDDDEYIVPVCANRNGERKLPDIIDSIFCEYEKKKFKIPGSAGGIGVNWRVYGTSNHITRPKGLIIENYNYRAPDNNEFNVHIKTICNPRVARGFFGNSHSVSYNENHYCISENGSYIAGPFFHDGKCERIRINHYQSKSQEEFTWKLNRGWPDQPHKKLPDEEIEWRIDHVTKECNEIYDSIMEKYVMQVKERLLL